MQDIQDQINYERVAAAIAYIHEHFKEQPALEQMARAVNLSPFHFQRLFTEWAGTSPKKFLQYISVGHAKQVLRENSPSLFETAMETGLSGSGRLHDLFITIEGMTPGEYKNGGENLLINYSYSDSLFGEALVASTDRGICCIAFADEKRAGLHDLKSRFPNADCIESGNPLHEKALAMFSQDNDRPRQSNNRSGRRYQTGEITRLNPGPNEQISLHLAGTPFQLRVWEALLKIPAGQLTTYGTIAAHLGQPKASRAVGTAVGRNPVAWLIPCHRVIQSTGVLGGYHWGSVRKSAMIGREAASLESKP